MFDDRTCCEACFSLNNILTPARKVAPMHTGGDVDRPAYWVPVCQDHFQGWYDGIAECEILPAFDLDISGRPATL